MFLGRLLVFAVFRVLVASHVLAFRRCFVKGVFAFLRGGPAVLDGCVQESTVFDTVCMVSDTF